MSVPSATPLLPFSPEAIVYRTCSGMPGSIQHTPYMQYGATSAIVSSTTETTLFNNSSTTAKGSLTFPAGYFNWNNGYDPAGLAPNSTAPGKLVRVKLLGSIGNTGTPTLRIKVKLTNSAGTVTTLVDSTALTMSTITTGLFELNADFVVAAYSATAGIINCGGLMMYTTATSGALLGLILPSTSTTSFDTTTSYTLDVTAQWGTSSASNTITATSAFIEVMN